MDHNLFFRPSLWALAFGSRKANKKYLKIFSNYFSKATEPQEIVSALNLGSLELNFLNRLALEEDGWKAVSRVFCHLETKIFKKCFKSLAQSGLILVKPFKNLIRLSDAGRFLLILLSVSPSIMAEMEKNSV
jgi:hypothetical protein